MASNQLDPPPLASTDGAIEVLRVWASNGQGQQFSLQPTWQDPGAWGLLLADVARYAASAYEREGMNGAEALSRIVSLFHAEMSSATDEPSDVPGG